MLLLCYEINGVYNGHVCILRKRIYLQENCTFNNRKMFVYREKVSVIQDIPVCQLNAEACTVMIKTSVNSEIQPKVLQRTKLYTVQK